MNFSGIVWKWVMLMVVLAPARATRGADDAVLYWAGSSSGVHRMPAAGGPSETLGSIPVPYYGLMTIHEGRLYWITTGDRTLMRAGLDGTGQEPADPASLPADVWLALRGGVRNAAGDEVFGLETDPSTGQRFSPVASVVADVAHGKVYWAGGWNNGGAGLIGRSDLDGSNAELLLDGLGFEDYTLDLVLDVPGGKMYWTNPNQGKIQRANLDGTGLEDVAAGVDATAIAINRVPEPGCLLVCGLAILMLRRRRVVHSAACERSGT